MKTKLTKASQGGVMVRLNNASIPDNNEVRYQKSNAKSSGGVNANFKAVVTKPTSKGSGKVNTPPKKASPSNG
jgi:hypothetical protein